MTTFKETYEKAIVAIDTKLSKSKDMTILIDTITLGMTTAVVKGEPTFAFEGLDAKDTKSNYGDVLWSIAQKSNCSMTQVNSYVARYFEKQGIVIQPHRDFLLFSIEGAL